MKKGRSIRSSNPPRPLRGPVRILHPGMLMSAKGLLDKASEPEEIVEAISGTCVVRCYNEIVKPSRPCMPEKGESHDRICRKTMTRYDGIGHVTAGRPMSMIFRSRNALHQVLTSPVHKGRIRRLDVSAAEKKAGVAGVLTAKDVPGANAYGLIAITGIHSGEYPVQRGTNCRCGSGG